MLYRAAVLSDLDAVIAMKNRVKARVIEEGLPIWLNGYPGDDFLFEDIRDGEGRVVLSEGKIVAYASFLLAEKEYGFGVFRKDKIYSFGRLMVDNGQIGKHIGSFMVEHLIEEARSLGSAGVGILVDAENARALHLYRKFGFEREGEKTFPYAHLDIYGLYF